MTDTGLNFKQLPNEILGINEKSEVTEAFNRFKWVGNNDFVVVSEAGLERHYEVSEAGFNEVAFNYRPLFNEIQGEEWKEWPYYAIRPNLEKNTLKRLQRMYQTYKSELYLMGRTTSE